MTIIYKQYANLLTTDVPDRTDWRYVYMFSHKGNPFYIGMGSGNRWKTHFYSLKENTPKNNKIKKIFEAGEKVDVSIIAKHLTLQEAETLEIRLIKDFGRKCDGGILTNLALGGESGNKGKKHTEETRKKMSVSSRGSTSQVSPEDVYKAKFLVHYRGYSVRDLLEMPEYSHMSLWGIKKWFSRSKCSHYKYVAPHFKTPKELLLEKRKEVQNLFDKGFTRKQIEDILGVEKWIVKSTLVGQDNGSKGI